jgi:hypothetical protein
LSGAASIEVVAKRGLVGFGYDQSPDEPAPVRIAVHVPDGFTFTPNAKGAPIGSVVGFDVFYLRTDARQPVTGVLTIADRAIFAAEGTACTGASSHDAVWAVSVPAPTAAVQIPILSPVAPSRSALTRHVWVERRSRSDSSSAS